MPVPRSFTQRQDQAVYIKTRPLNVTSGNLMLKLGTIQCQAWAIECQDHVIQY